MNKCLTLFYLLFISLNYSNNNFENSLVFNFIKSDTTKYLFLDDRIIKQTFNVKLEVGKVEKHPNNPLFTEDKEWEMRFDNLYGNVIFDKDEKIYKLWYSPFIVDSKNVIKEIDTITSNYAPPPIREMGICYATSEDGINWKKSNLGLVRFNGNKNNNIVWRRPHGAGIFKDYSEKDPEKLYKVIYKHNQEWNWGLGNGNEGNSLAVAFSADGLNWSDKINIMDLPGDTHNNANWIPNLDKYVAMTRDWVDVDGKEKKQRAVIRIESSDFIKWENPKQVLVGQNFNLQTYAMPYFFYEGVYLGLVAIHDQKSDRVWTELAWSPDTINWTRIDVGNPLIPNSEIKLDYDYGCVYACAAPIIKKDKIEIFYGSSDYRHSGWRNGSFSMATLRTDGFAGYKQINAKKEGIIITQNIKYNNGLLKINADFNDKGSLKVTVLNKKGKEIAISKTIKKTSMNQIVQFDRKITENNISLKFTINDAKLYSFLIGK